MASNAVLADRPSAAAAVSHSLVVEMRPFRFECCKVVKKVRAIKRGDHQSRRPEISLCPVPGALLVPEGAPRAYPHCTLKLSRRNPFTVGILTELRARDGEPDWSTLPGGPRRAHVPLKYLSDQS